jgi:hypothetical protein
MPFLYNRLPTRSRSMGEFRELIHRENLIVVFPIVDFKNMDTLSTCIARHIRRTPVVLLDQDNRPHHLNPRGSRIHV